MKIYKHTHWILYCLFIFACARQTTPTGGPKDSIPPTLIGSYPRHGQINFKGNNIQLTFSETIILNNPREQLIITPGLPENVDATAKKSQVTIDLNQPLEENTTYTINFRDAVQDITEKNPARNLKIAFSTGPYLDSLAIEGYAFDLLAGKPIKDATVAIYAADTFNIFQHKPPYFTKTDEEGYFKLENLKPGSYRIYGIQDKNKNLVIDSKSESYGFLSSYIILTSNIDDLSIPLVRLDSRPLRLMNARPDLTYFSVNTSKSLTDFNINSSTDEHIIASFGKDQSNVRIYNTFENKDSVQINFSARDSINNQLDTTLYVKFSTRAQKPDPFEVTPSGLSVIGPKALLQGTINFSKPLLKINYDSLFFRIDSINTIPITADDINMDSLRNRLTIKKSFDKTLLPKVTDARTPNVNRTKKQSGTDTPIENQFYFGKAAFISIELDSSQQKSETVKPTKLEDTGIIFVAVETGAQYYFVQLLDKQLNIVQAKTGSSRIAFEDVKPGEYQLRLVLDDNNDGKWSPGNFYDNKQPEEIIFYRNDKGSPIVTLKANWELGPLLIKH
jgi:uncharacterized protein (DUF2141 family)